MAGEPTFATRPTRGAKHDLWEIEIVARALGVPLMPWQRLVARVASERQPDNSAKFRYHTVILTVPRQCGKTTLMRAILTQRALMNRGRRSFYTAQTGKDATARWKDLISQIEQSVLAEHVTTRMAQGSQTCMMPNGSSISPFAPTPKSLHGYTPHDVMLDEIFEWSTEQGSSLMGAVKPAQQTLDDRQLWLVSTMGTEDSDFLNGWLEQGRQAVTDPNSGFAYFEWSLADGLDEYDPENWDFHPAIGHTITKETLQESTDSHTRGEWNRAYMNRRTKNTESWVPLEDLDKVLHSADAIEAPQGEVHLAFDIDPKPGSGAAIVAAWLNGEGVPVVKIYKARTDSRSWVAQDVGPLSEEFASMSYDNSPVNRNAAAKVNVNFDLLQKAEDTSFYTSACMMLRELIDTHSIIIEDDEAGLTRAALQSVVTKPLGEGWAISRARSNGDVSIAAAAAVALKKAMHERQAPAPMVYV